MDVFVIIISLIIGAIIVIAVLWLFRKPVIDQLFYLMEEKTRKVIKDEGEQTNKQFEEKRNSIKELINRIHEDLNKSHRKIEETEKERIGEFSKLKTVFEEYKTITHDLKESTDHLKNILSNNQLRGKYREQIAEELLKSTGFVVYNLSNEFVDYKDIVVEDDKHQKFLADQKYLGIFYCFSNKK